MPKYLLEIGLKGNTIEHDQIVEARTIDEAQDRANHWAIEEYCIAHATPIDDAGKLMVELDDLTSSIRGVIRSLSRNEISGEDFRSPKGCDRAERFLRAMRDGIDAATKQSIEGSEIDDL